MSYYVTSVRYMWEIISSCFVRTFFADWMRLLVDLGQEPDMSVSRGYGSGLGEGGGGIGAKGGRTRGPGKGYTPPRRP